MYASVHASRDAHADFRAVLRTAGDGALCGQQRAGLLFS